MSESFAEILKAGGKSNSLGRAGEVGGVVLQDRSRLEDLYLCLFNEDAWVTMRAADTLEKICRQHPDWLLPYVDRFIMELGGSTQPSVQWHLAQIYQQVPLSAPQRDSVIHWLDGLVATTEIDWIVSANVMDALVYFMRQGAITNNQVKAKLQIQQQHKSKSVVRRASKLLQVVKEADF